MTIGLGIDTGGTYTDTAILDMESGDVLSKAKALTTRDDLVVGIKESIAALDQEVLRKVSLVSLSSTLATNSIVEGKGGRVACVLIGMESRERMPVTHSIEVDGGHYLNGTPQAVFDHKAVASFVESVKDEVDAFAVSSLLSIRNPEHELHAKKIVEDLSGLPVVCGHELTSKLGFYERAVTAVLNARLIPTIKELLIAVKEVLGFYKVKAPLMVVKGDGSFMSESMALSRPIETVLSGPAASMVGARYLTGEADGVPVDIGGTTTDIGVLRSGMPSVDDEGAMIGGWRTRVRAVDVMTSGIGGDSRVMAFKGGFRLSPSRVIPLCIAVRKHPELMDALHQTVLKPRRLKSRIHNPDNIPQLAEFIKLSKKPSGAGMSAIDKNIVKALEKGPMSIFDLGILSGFDPYHYNLRHLEAQGVISRIGFTPTDAMHASGRYLKYDQEASILGARIQSRVAMMSVEGFCEAVMNSTIERITESVIMKLTAEDSGHQPECKFARRLMELASKAEKGKDFSIILGLDKPIMGIGAPAGAYLPEVAKRLSTHLLLPEHSEVGNAVGAIASSVVERMEAVIKPKKGQSASEDCPCMVFTPDGRTDFPTLDAAKDFAINYSRDKVLELAQRSGAIDPEVDIDVDDEYGDFGYGQGRGLYIGSKVIAIAVGKPDAKTIHHNGAGGS